MKKTAIALIAGIVIGYLIAAWMQSPIAPAVQAPDSPKVADTKKEDKDCTKVSAYVPSVKKKLGLSEAVQKNDQASVIAVSPVLPSDRPRTALALFYRDTGKGEIWLQDDPYPLIGKGGRWNVGAFYTFRDDRDALSPVWRVQGAYELLQIKALHVGATGQLDTDGRRSIGAGFWITGK